MRVVLAVLYAYFCLEFALSVYACKIYIPKFALTSSNSEQRRLIRDALFSTSYMYLSNFYVRHYLFSSRIKVREISQTCSLLKDKLHKVICQTARLPARNCARKKHPPLIFIDKLVSLQ